MEAQGVSQLWRNALAWSLRTANEAGFGARVVVDCGGGDGWFSTLVDPNSTFIASDIDIERLAAGEGRNRVRADSQRLPFADESVDVVVSVSSCQYIDHGRFFAECRRILRPGGMVLLHENGRYNPTLVAARLGRVATTLFSPRWRRYHRTVQRYVTRRDVDLEGFAVDQFRPYYLLSSLGWVCDLIRLQSLARGLEGLLMPMDAVLLRIPGLRTFAFLNVVHLRKIG